MAYGEQAAEPERGEKPPREVSPDDKALSADLLKRIEAALARPGIKEAHKQFEVNRRLLGGKDKDGKPIPANLYFANLASMRPQVYAKDPEYACTPKASVSEEQLQLVKKFGQTAEAVLTEELVRRTKLKKRAKRLLTSAYTTSVGWWKLCWQEVRRPAGEAEGPTDPIIVNQLKDTQDNLRRLENLKAELADPQAGSEHDLTIAELKQTLAGLTTQQEVVVSRGLTLDFVMSEDIIVLDPSVREVGDYERASAIGHRVWMSRDAYRERFGYDCSKGKAYSEQAGQMQGGTSTDKKQDLLCVWEVWDQESNRVLTLCDGEEGFCEPPSSPDWTGERWYPFFLCAFNEIEGTFYPLSDIELTKPQIEEINKTAQDFNRDRKGSLPLNVARKGGTLTDDDLKRLSNREGSDLVLIEGIGGRPISDDLWSGQLGKIDPANYDTSQARTFMEQIIGGGDAARGSVLKAKTATEAEILSQGLRSRSSERQDIIEDMLTEVGVYALQILLRKLTPEEVQRIAGPDAQWPQMTMDQIFDQVTLEVRGGSTGKPDRLQEQDRWTKLLPVIEKTVQQVAELRAQGQGKLAEALTELTRETLRRFDERLDINQFLPPVTEEGQEDPEALKQALMQGKKKMEEMAAELAQLKSAQERGFVSAASSIATSANPVVGAQAFGATLKTLMTGGEAQPMDPMAVEAERQQAQQMLEAGQRIVAELQGQVQQLQQQLAEAGADSQAEVEKARIKAASDVQVAQIVAPIEASAKVEIARINAMATVAAAPREEPEEVDR